MFSIPTWRLLGLSVGIQYTALALTCFVAPQTVIEFFGLSQSTGRSETSFNASLDKARQVHARASALLEDAQHEQDLIDSMLLLGARDITIGAAICTFCYLNDTRAMAVTIISGLLTCAADVVAVYRLKGPQAGLQLGVGAAVWGGIGIGMLMEGK